MNLGPQVGPFPVGVWAGLAGTGIVAGLAIRRAGWFESTGDTLPVVDAAEPTSSITPGQRISPGAIALPGTPTASPNPTTVDDRPTTNSDWATQAVQLLISKGTTPTVADTAIRKYLAGMALGVPEVAAVNLALASPLGPPPEGAPPITTLTTTDNPTNPVPPAPVPADLRQKRGQLGESTTTVLRKPSGKGETPREVALRVYGQPDQWNFLRVLNQQSIGADGKAPLRVGITLRY